MSADAEGGHGILFECEVSAGRLRQRGPNELRFQVPWSGTDRACLYSGN